MALAPNGMLKMTQIWAEFAAGTISNFNLRRDGSTNADWCPKNTSLGRGHNNCAISHYWGASSTSCIVGSGGNSVVTEGVWKIHKITNSNASTRFTVTSIASGGMDNNLYRMITAGGGGGGGGGNAHQQNGGASRCGGGGGGGQTALATYAAVAGAGNGAVPGKPGAGGTYNNRGATGGSTIVDASATFYGGGGGGTYSNGNTETGLGGGNGGGGAGKYGASNSFAGGTGRQKNGGAGNSGGGGGGGGSEQAGAAGVPGANDTYRYGGKGGNGLNYTVQQTRYGAGGTGAGIGHYKDGGVKGGGRGGKSVSPTPSTGYATAGSEKGAGGGGGGSYSNGVYAESGKQGDYGAMYIAYRTC